ncbi:MAG: hypothetical protein GY711_07265 [bacterium]|nr:hypothetical protein [bacterium]
MNRTIALRVAAPASLLSFLVIAAPCAAQRTACVWETLTPSPQPRYEGPPVVIDGQMYMFGGFRNTAIQATTSVNAYDPVADSWSAKAPMPVAVTHIGAALDDRTVWVVGGFNGDDPGTATDRVWLYDVDLDQWGAGPSLPKLVAGGVAARFGRNLHYYGGVEADRNTMSSDHLVLDLDNPGGGWSTLAPLPQPRCHLAGTAFGGKLYAIGGQFNHDVNPVDQTLVQSYDPLTDAWTTVQPLPDPVSHHETGIFVLDGKIVVTGGKSFPIGFPTISDMTAYDPATNTWEALPAIPRRLFGVGAAAIDDYVYVTAGATSSLSASTQTLRRHKTDLYGEALRINSAGDVFTSPSSGLEWCDDFNYFAGEELSNVSIPDITGTDDDELYRTARTAPNGDPNLLVYRFTTNPGPYRLRMHFAEIDGAVPGARVFDIRIEGSIRESDLDVAQLVGQGAALVRQYDYYSNGGATLVCFERVNGRPMVNAIELIQLPDASFENYCSSGPNSTGSAAVMSHTGSSSIAANDLELVAAVVPADFGIFFYGADATSVPFGHGVRCVELPLFRLFPAVLANQGELRFQLDVTNPPQQAAIISAGSTWNFQAWFRDNPAGPPGFDTSDGLRITFVP